jgi:hypothetical protein
MDLTVNTNYQGKGLRFCASDIPFSNTLVMLLIIGIQKENGDNAYKPRKE